MPQTTLSLAARNLPDKDIIGHIDPYYEIYFKDALLYKSEVLKGSHPEWKVASFEVPKRAYMREPNLKVIDKDTFSKDDLLFEVEIRYPFRQKTYTIGDTPAQLMVLNDDGESADSLSDGSLVEGDDGKKRKRKKKESGYFSVTTIGKKLLKMKVAK